MWANGSGRDAYLYSEILRDGINCSIGFSKISMAYVDSVTGATTVQNFILHILTNPMFTKFELLGLTEDTQERNEGKGSSNEEGGSGGKSVGYGGKPGGLPGRGPKDEESSSETETIIVEVCVPEDYLEYVDASDQFVQFSSEEEMIDSFLRDYGSVENY